MDLTESIVPNSQQVNAEDLIGGPLTVTITGVTKGTAEQPVFIDLQEFPGRTYRPSKTQRRILVVAWGAEASAYIGRQLTLYRNPEIAFGGVKVGGIEIAAMSHIDKSLTVALTATRGRRKDHTVKPLEVQHHATSATPEVVQDPVLVNEWLETITAAQTQTQLKGVWEQIVKLDLGTVPALITAKNTRKTEVA